jgi:HAD superfamily hydrolase (TIGR01509 family)
MPWLRFGPVYFDGDLIAFDKDGTLIEFEAMWGRLALAWIERLTADVGDEVLRQKLCDTLGYDPHEERTRPQSPLAVATTAHLQAIAASVLYCHGIPWSHAEDRVRAAFRAVADLPLASLVHPIGDVAGLMARLREVGVRVAVVTTDHRAETDETLRLLGVADLVDHMVCGDDGVPTKPAPDMVLATCERLGIEPSRAAVVGDTEADLLMAQRAGVGLKVAVRTGAGDPATLKSHADVVLRSIEEIDVGV